MGEKEGNPNCAGEILSFLATAEASEIRDKQRVVVVPVSNPEGFVLEQSHSSMQGITSNERRVWANFALNTRLT